MGRVKGWISNDAHHIDKAKPQFCQSAILVYDTETRNLICATGPHYKPGISPKMTVPVLLGEISHHFT